MVYTDELLYCLPPEKHSAADIAAALRAHREVKFISLVGIDVFGHDTDEKIPAAVILDETDKFLRKGVQTDGSSVFLPAIASISNARVDIIPDPSVNWYVEYNGQNIDEVTGRPVGTLRIPAFLVHNSDNEVGSRVILRDAEATFKRDVLGLLRSNPYVFAYLPFDSADEIEDIYLTAATELEFYVRTPHESADKERLHASQEMKEQYWKRTLGPVRTAMEKTIEVLEHYGFGVEMGHKEVGGVKAQMVEGGEYSHIMEQLEIDWRYAAPMQAADNDRQVRYIVRDVFRECGLDVTFMAKPVNEVAGSGKHIHLGVCARLKNGKKVNLFTSCSSGQYMSPVGFGALMGILKNYEIIAPFASANNDAFNRLKPGYEAPVCVCTSLGRSPAEPSRNRTVLIGLIRDAENPMATHFELRSPSPKSNTHMVLAASILSMLDGIRAVLEAGKTPDQLCASVSKAYGDEDFYFEKNRIYRAENNIFADYTGEERARLFGKAPATVYECVRVFTDEPEKAEVLYTNNSMSHLDLVSYRTSVVGMWAAEIRERLIPDWKEFICSCRKVACEDETSLDVKRWAAIAALRKTIMQDTETSSSLLTRLSDAVKNADYDLASDLQLEARSRIEELDHLYREYIHNLIRI